MRTIPRDAHFDSTLSFLADPYRYISSTCKELNSEIFLTRFLLRKTICLKGKEAAALFYSDQFQRKGAAPEPLKATLFGKGGVQTLDGKEHKHRKKMFMDLMSKERIAQLISIAHSVWAKSIVSWSKKEQISLYDEAQLIHAEVIFKWFGIEIPSEELPERTNQLVALFDSAVAKNLAHFKARIKRRKSEKWIRSLVKDIRANPSLFEQSSPIVQFSLFRDPEGKLLPLKIAAVEILNILRPTVAVSVYIIFIAHALHSFKEKKAKVENEADEECFVQEVRRFYPFFPAVTALVREDLTWKGFKFKKKDRVLLDIYGTNHDPKLWKNPNRFRPERFKVWQQSPFDFIPQGGGNHSLHHRCPGEWITIDLMKVALHYLMREINYEIGEQNLNIDKTRLPAIVKSRFIISNVNLVS